MKISPAAKGILGLAAAFLLLAGGFFLGSMAKDGTYTVNGQGSLSLRDGEGSLQNGVYAGKININTAGVELLQTLPGIGEVRAQAIVDDRRENGAYSDVEDLMRVSGIGQGTLDDIKNYITVG